MSDIIFTSPTEHHREFSQLPYKVSSLPETLGADFCFTATSLGMVGVQRKAVPDLVASIRDGRLAKEIGQMEALSLKCLIIEGNNYWTRDGESILVNGWSETQQTGIIFSLFLKHFLVLETESPAHTSRSILRLQKYLAKSNHSSLERRPKATGTWGKADNKEFSIHVLQSFPGVGPELAGRIFDKFGLPLSWTIDIMDLQQLDGVGLKKAIQIFQALGKKDADA